MPKLIDLTGQRFGSRVVLSRAKNAKHGAARWKCRCVCGTVALVDGAKLLDGKGWQCLRCSARKRGQSLSVDMTGQRFGTRTVLRRAGINSSGAALWKCRCDCGEVSEVDGSSLRKGLARACRSCAQKESNRRARIEAMKREHLALLARQREAKAAAPAFYPGKRHGITVAPFEALYDRRVAQTPKHD